MASISLRTYNHEIESLIDHGQAEEAIAHCRHILEFVPKHIGTYRLLGKAFLETRRYSDAADIFQRVLSSVPDDFVANIGMSIIREDEKNLESAIWHMERAFESQPSNAAIQEELRRLYGKRDGMEPPKVRLTRGALSRMYFKGNLFNQAISELRAALSEDPQRMDLQVLLAQAYYASGQFTEAIEICNLILKKLPYCLEANRILAAVLPETDRLANVKEYQQRLVSLDPYYGSISPKASTSDEVPEKAVVIERLEYKPGAPAAPAEQPAWASSLGVAFKPEQEALPDWLETEKSSETAPQEAPAEPFITGEEALESSEAQIPDWMKEAGWSPSTGPEVPPPPFDETLETPQAEGEIVPGELPDWLRDIAPSEALKQGTGESTILGDEVLPWLEESQPGASDTVISWLDQQKAVETPQAEPEAELEPTEQEALPDWMSGLDLEAEKTTSQEPVEEDRVPTGELPDWIKEFSQPEEQPSSGLTDWFSKLEAEKQPAEAEQAFSAEAGDFITPPVEEPSPAAAIEMEVPPVEPAEEIPDWLQEIKAEVDETQPTFIPPSAEPALTEAPEVEAAPAEEIPDWLKTLEATSVAAEVAAPEMSAVPKETTPIVEPPSAQPEISPAEMTEDQAIAWLESLASKKGVPEEELPALQPEPAEEVPEQWVEMEAETPAASSEEELVTPIVPEWLAEAAPDLGAAQPEGETIDWLKELEKSVPVEEPAAEQAESQVEAAPAEEIPNWLKAIESETPVEEAPTLLAPQEVEPAPVLEEMDQDAAFAWLESLAKGAEVTADEGTVPPQESAEETAPWELETPAEGRAFEGEAAAEPEKPERVVPDWLLEATPETTPEPAQPTEAIPDWLAGVEEETPAAAEVTEPEVLFEETVQVPVSEPGELEPPAAQPEAEAAPQEDALAWLETLARKHGVPEEQLVTHPLKPVEEPPAWVQAEVEASLEPVEAVSAEAEMKAEEPPAEVTEPTFAVEEEFEPAPPIEIEAEPVLPSDETVPSWLVADFTQPAAAPEIEETAPAELQPAPLLDLNQASLSDLEDLPGIGFILAQAIVNYRQEHGDFSSVEALNQVSGIGPERIAELKNWVEVFPTPSRYEAAAEGPSLDDEQVFTQAQNALALGDLPAANASFSILVRKQVFLTEIIDALKQALAQHPDDLFSWQTLGDAHVRKDQLQEALDAYVKAEELLS